MAMEPQQASPMSKMDGTRLPSTVPEKPKLKCLGFTYNGAKLFNMLPCRVRETKNPDIFKTLSKEWIWENIPSY